jgi:peptidoglycan/xylan/chitin deacetylase (PgdA/CDA1 family)
VPQAIILLYHRVCELPSDPQLLCVSPKNFSEHLDVIGKSGRTVQIKDLGNALRYRNAGQPTIIVTFDDGYADNLHLAKPILESHEVPATVFVTTGYLGVNREFWSDDLERIVLHESSLPETLRLKVNGEWHHWELGSVKNGRRFSDYSDWNVACADAPTARHSLYRSLYQLLFPLPHLERQSVLENLSEWAGLSVTGRRSHRVLSCEELRLLGDDGLVEIGSHTISHPSLSQQSAEVQTNEIRGSKARLEEILGHRVTSFAYPYGGLSHYTNRTVVIVREAGFEWACSNFPGSVRSGTDHWQLPRFLVRNWDGEEFAGRLRRWLQS